jgi:putative component of membrane protein insertase Oxa1/YidC/SpoIIIJ protein YidD
MLRLTLILITLLPSLSSYLFAQSNSDNGSEPWEVLSNHQHIEEDNPPTFTDFLIGGLISSYQENAAKNSISRCPFSTSCSVFGKHVIHRYGVLGVCMFLDRYLYREHKFMQLYYVLKVKSNGLIRYDDDYFKDL